jgi:O-Antigen ligase
MAAELALAVYVPLLLVASVVVWRKPVLALYAFVVGLALHNAVMAALFEAGVRGAALTTIQAWKEVLLAVAAARIAATSWQARRLPFRPRTVDALALTFGVLVVAYALVPQDVLGGQADREAVLYGLRHALLPVAAYFVGRSLTLSGEELRRLAWTILGTASAVAAIGLVEEYTVSVERWRDAGVPDYFRDELGFDYRGPGGMPENFAFNTDEGLFRRLISTFLSPLASAFLFAVALLLAAAGGALRRSAAALLTAVVAAGLLFTLSRSTLIALVVGLVVVAYALRRPWPLAAAVGTIAAGLVFTVTFTSFAPTTHFFPEELEEQERIAQLKGGLPESELSLEEPSIKSHLTNLRDGLETVVEHPQGYGLGNAGAIAVRQDVEPRAGESNYTEIGAEVGLAGLVLFVGWSIVLLLVLLRTARTGPEAVRWAAAGVAAGLAAVLALGLQTDAFGVPWLAYCLWFLAGALVTPAPVRATTRSADDADRRREPRRETPPRPRAPVSRAGLPGG